jgi:cyanophycinase
MRIRRRPPVQYSVFFVAVIAVGAACASFATRHQSPSLSGGGLRVGPAHGTVLLIGGGDPDPDLIATLIRLAGGPDSLIVDVPTADGKATYGQDWQTARALRAAGAKHVLVLHTLDRSVANADSFVAPLEHAGAVLFDGGRQWRLVDAYAGTKTERAFRSVIDRGGMIGGSSAGASILASFLLRGDTANAEIVVGNHQSGFGYLRNTAVDQHVVARQRIGDIVDSLLPRHPELLGISIDESTALIVRGDTGTVLGRSKVFFSGARIATDAGKPFVTLRSGDAFDLGSRQVLHRAIGDTRLSETFVDSLMRSALAKSRGPATILVAQAGKVIVDKGYDVSPAPHYMPETTLPTFALGELSRIFDASAALMLERGGKLKLAAPLDNHEATTAASIFAARSDTAGVPTRSSVIASTGGMQYVDFMTRRLISAAGLQQTFPATDNAWRSNVDDLYRWELALEFNAPLTRSAQNNAFAPVNPSVPAVGLGWYLDSYRGLARMSAYGNRERTGNAFVRVPERGITIIILSRAPDTAVTDISTAILDRLLGPRGAGQ